MNTYDVVLEKKEFIGTQAVQLTLKFPPTINFDFNPGQYIWLVIPKLNFPDPKGDRRAFSITSSSAEKNKITILVRISDSGFKKTILDLVLDSPLQIIGPFGSSYLVNPRVNNKIVMIAGGVGIAPFSSIIRSLHFYPIPPKIQIIYCSTSPETSSFTADLDQLCSQNDILVTKHLGDFRETILPTNIDFMNDEFYVCGPEALINVVCTILHNKNVPLGRIHLEQFYPLPPANLTEADFILKPGEKNIMLQAVQDSKNHVIITDASGKIIYANKAAEKNTGFTFDEMRGNTPRLWGGMMPVEFYRSFWQQKKEALGFDGQITNRRKNGQPYNVIVHISPIFDSKHVVIGYIGTEEDITNRLNLQQQVLGDKIRDEAILQSIGEGVIVQDSQDKVIFINAAAISMLQYPSTEVIGHPFEQIVKSEDLSGRFISREDRPIVKAAKTKQLVNSQLVYIRRDGSKFISDLVITPILINDQYFGVVQVFKDKTKEAEIDKMKSEFISLASHQLRTPLSTINWYTESLLTGETGQVNPDQEKFLNEIYSASKRMVALVNALLNVSRIELGTITIEPQMSDLVKLLETEVSSEVAHAKVKNIQVNLDKTADKLEVSIDVKLMQMVVQNILENAIKYSPDHAKIEIRLDKKADDIIIAVVDHGIGIPLNEQSKIFLKLFRATNAKEKISDGNGLGLYLAKMIMDQSGGKIWFDSVEGQGTTFYISLPLSGMIKKDGTKKMN